MGDETLWGHSHGLRRLGLVELEVLGDSTDHGFAGAVINAVAAAMLTAGLVPPGTGIRMRDDQTVEWHPWESFDWDDELGGANDRGDVHGEPVGLIVASDDEPLLAPGLAYDDAGWAEPADGEPSYAQVARQTAAGAFSESMAHPGRAMWMVAGETDGSVVAFDGMAFTVVDDASGARVSVPADMVEHWGVATASDFCLGPWAAHNAPVIEDVETAWGADYDADGRLLCTLCRTPLGDGHSCNGA